MAVQAEDAARLLEALRWAVGPAGEERAPATGDAAMLVLVDARNGEEAHIRVAWRDSSVMIAVAHGMEAEQREVAVPRELARALAYQLEAALQWVSRHQAEG